MENEKNKNLIPPFLPFPACIVTSDGKVRETNKKIAEVFAYGDIDGADIFALTGYKYSELGVFDKICNLERNSKIFKLVRESLEDGMIIYFYDVTTFEGLKQMYLDEKTCIMLISVDNLDEIIARTDEEKQSQIIASVDKAIRTWLSKYDAAITKYSQDMYSVVVSNKSIEKITESKFSILDEVRSMETEVDFPLTLSIGVGIGGKNPAQSDEYATDAHNLALGRGGDQAVIKRVSKIEYYGGKTQTVEKSNKGKSRIVGHALKQLMTQADRIFIMGHKNPDMDSFGSALGIYRLAASVNKESHIVINTYNETLAEIFLQAKETDEYSFVNREKALELATADSLIIILDTNRPKLCECEELLDVSEKIVIIDHHRLAEDYIENPTLSYIEPYASSTAEMVSEIFQYVGEKKSLTKLEAEGLLAGMAIDTNRFALKTGVRTFESAAWLRRNGADTNSVKRFFQEDPMAFKIKAKCLNEAEFLSGGFVVSKCEGEHPNMQIINSQAADEFLEIKGIKASIVLAEYNGKTLVSARSLGDVNVQLLMEKFGGGGHMTTAGAQLDMPIDQAMKEVKEMLSAMTEE